MDLKLNREIIGTNEVIFDSIQEQSVELDYILPDYFPDIFKLIKCQMEPRIVSSNVSGDRVNYEMVVCIRILYCCEQSRAVQCVEQKMNYSKTLDLGKNCECPTMTLRAKADYVNCRVVNQRRLDMRGAISTKIKITCVQKQPVLSDAFGMNIQLKKNMLSFAANRLEASKRITVNEEIDLGYSKPSVISIVRNDAVIASYDRKIIANKLIIKGDAQVNFLYSCQKENDDSLEAMQFTLPFSQIVDMEGIDERFETFLDVAVVSCDLIPKTNAEGENKLLECELSLLLQCTAIRNGSVDVVSDAYSTTFPCEYSVQSVRVDKAPRSFSDTCITKTAIECKDSEIGCIYDAWSRVNNLTVRANPEKRQILFLGSVSYSVLARNEMGTPIMLESDVPFEHCIEMENLTDECTVDAKATAISCSYNLASTSTVELKAEIRVTGCVNETATIKILSDISFDESHTKARDGNYALKLYFADAGENIWEIAKKYSTSVEAIMEENELEEEILPQRGMILIPILG